MSGDIEIKRAFVVSLGHSPEWKKKVAKMSDGQVLAIWFKEQNKESEPKRDPDTNDEIPF